MKHEDAYGRETTSLEKALAVQESFNPHDWDDASEEVKCAICGRDLTDKDHSPDTDGDPYLCRDCGNGEGEPE